MTEELKHHLTRHIQKINKALPLGFINIILEIIDKGLPILISVLSGLIPGLPPAQPPTPAPPVPPPAQGA